MALVVIEKEPEPELDEPEHEWQVEVCCCLVVADSTESVLEPVTLEPLVVELLVWGLAWKEQNVLDPFGQVFGSQLPLDQMERVALVSLVAGLVLEELRVMEGRNWSNLCLVTMLALALQGLILWVS